MSTWVAVLIAMFIWWFSTGTILMVVKHADRKGPAARRFVTWAALPLLALGAYGLWWSLPYETLFGVYVAFLSALAIWGWIELAFLTGQITGPNSYPLPNYTPPLERFIRAWGTVAYHELLLVFALLLIGIVAFDAPNAFGFWTFAILFFARISAKLNLFLGVPRIHSEFLPNALSHLPSHFRTAQMNALFPISVSALTFAVACWLERLYVSQSPGEIAGFALLTALTALALLEHWVMVLPIPDERLWRWMLPAEAPAPKPKHETTKTGGHHGL